MELHGKSLAQAHRVQAAAGSNLLLARLKDNEGVLDDASTLLTQMVQDEVRITPAGEWLLDNYYLIEEQIRTARRHLPKGYSRELPTLSEGASAGLPRVYDLAMEAIAHGDGRIDAETMTRFAAAYQSVTPLKLGELWAIPIMLRLALIENLRRMAVRVMRDGLDHRRAAEWSHALNETADQNPKDVVLIVADMARSNPPMTGAFVAELVRGLQGRSAALAMPISWIDQWLTDSGRSVEELVRAESQQQASDQVSISNSIGSLRFLANMDWREFVETMSLVDQTLREDPLGVYALMDFNTRDMYRHVVEKLARRSGADEVDVARVVLNLAREAGEARGSKAHVGYYLIDDGAERIKSALADSGRARTPVGLSRRRVPLLAYLLPIAMVATGCACGLLWQVRGESLSAAAQVSLAALAFLAFSELGIHLVNWLATVLIAPKPLPRLDYSKGLPSNARSLVVVPTMLGDVDAIDRLVEGLEVRFLANRDPYLHFALLTDFLDADQQTLPGDDARVAHAARQIERLNGRYAGERGDLFFLFHRPRVWNAQERKWMGLERKRGKLAALNRLLRGGSHEAFSQVTGNTDALANVRYVITLDTDTRLPRDAAREFIATLAHPLNQARFDERRKRVTRGYGILQPSVGSGMSERRGSRYARMFGSEAGIDPYTRTVSDVYQDLFAEGSFVGKGIYDVDAFEHALADRLPDNRVLSHDLLEGCYARAGLISDVRLFEDYPSRYAADVKRRYRWIRGDWQLLPWLLPWVPRMHGGFERNPLSWLSRGKLLDNLRRSLVAPAALALLVWGWATLPQPLAWTLWLLALWLAPMLVLAGWELTRRPVDMALETHLVQVGSSLARELQRAWVTLACLPFEAFFSLGAIARTLWRMTVSHRRLLQWNPSSEVERSLGDRVGAELRDMWFAPVFAVAVAVMLARVQPASLWIAAPLLASWLIAPGLMAWLGRPPKQRRAGLSHTQLRFLGRLARRTWAFFEVHIREEDHWLPPDNFQEHPTPVVARRTSPTNIGLSLLANLSAYDLGYVQAGALIERTRLALATLESLPRHRGHFYNWYDTATLLPLPPRYISSVDSGNLAAHLLTLRQGLLALADEPLITPTLFQGLADTCGVLEENLRDARAPVKTVAQSQAVAAFREQIDAILSAPPQAPREIERCLAELSRLAQAIESAWPVADGADADAAPRWPRALSETCRGALQEFEEFLPAQSRASATMPSLRDLAKRPDDDEGLRDRARRRVHELERLAHIAGQLSLMEYEFLYDRARHLLSIGYNVEERRLDAGFYDLLASEARLCSFVAIAQGQLPQETWFSLGRLLTEIDSGATLLSWSGSMFEYLMPQLVMPSYPDTLLDQTSQHAVLAQIHYGRQRDVPWGISESGYNTVDTRMNYQYRAFGVPGLGLKRGLGQDLVIAPYASTMALMVMPEAACQNLQRLTELGFAGEFGLYEAIDYTPARVPRGQTHAVVRSFMAHHQGMGLLSLDYLLRDQPMQKRFVADAEFQATLLLLQERIPRTGVFHPHEAEASGGRAPPPATETQLRVFRNPATARPAVQLLSNGRYHGLLSSAGGGYSRLGDMAVTRWREDATRDHWGAFCYLRDVDSGEFWSATHQPTCVPMEHYEAIFSDAKAEFRGRKHRYETHLEIAISAEDDIELRRLRVSNRSRRTRTIEITTYAEVVLASALSDELHPAFSNLFVQTRIERDKQALLCTRRPRSSDEIPPWMFHLVAVHDADISQISYETDRARFLGRGNTPRTPRAMTGDDKLSDSAGSVLDPIVAIRTRIVLAPDQTAIIDMVTGVGGDRAGCATLIDRYRDRRLADRVFDLAWTHSQVVRRQINASQADAQLYERLAGSMVYAHPYLRAEQAVLLQNRRGQSGLWGHSISGDFPIVLLQIAESANIELVRQMVQAHAYWRLKGLNVDLVIWNEEQSGYRQQLQEQILGLVSAGPEGSVLDRPGGIFVRPIQQMSQEDRILLQSVARVIISDRRGTLAAQVSRHTPPERAQALLWPDGAPLLAEPAAVSAPVSIEASPLLGLPPPQPGDDDTWPFEAVAEAVNFDNGTGAFAADAREYVIVLREGAPTPAPWSNVMANARLGTVVSESAPGYTWFENAHEYRLTPWHNDPVADTGGEAFYLRDEDSGRVWSPMPLPCRGRGAYRTRHGFGYSVYEHVEDGIASELWVYVGLEDAVKYSVLRLRNRSGRARRLSAVGYVEWVLGDIRSRSQMHVVSEVDPASGALTARNPYNTEFEGRVAFFDTDADGCSFTADRGEFIGRNGDLGHPAALLNQRLSGRLGVGMDPCAAIQVPVALASQESMEIVFRLGAADDAGGAAQLAQRSKGLATAHDALDAVRMHWTRTLSAIRVETPEPGVDALVNGWLPYQALACRYVARSGYYQSGGAFGFRDQLQDTMATVHAMPALSREHLLLSAAHQFPQGDAMHWWHPPLNRGVRTRCSDDFLWLPVAACRYLQVTGDVSVLDEPVSFVEGRPLNADEESYYDRLWSSDRRQPFYDHCVLALQRGAQLLGERGLPLIGSGDWNDGMNRVGEAGRGESVWLGFFLFDALNRFGPIARARGDEAFADYCAQSAQQLRENLQAQAWDGEWYRRAWFDDGTPLGSHESDECRIDSISQSWSVLSGVADPARARQAMDSLDRHLVRRDAGLIQLLDPPFDRTEKDPGYIRGYVPGVRENGGQYTHAAVWAAMAFAELGDGARAWELARMINPIHHSSDAESAARYKVEPYVLAADVYGVAPHVGRGGWTWYTGSAGWMYRLLTESLLGLHREGDRMRIAPCIPADWPEYQLHYRFGDTRYQIRVRQSPTEGGQGGGRLSLDEVAQDGLSFALIDDGNLHRVEVEWPGAPR
ncbi:MULTISPECIES: glucoamylase family protein [unclassified Lysobacter]|uniref:GH36-type glycosyl hydrolase domain-containing protein n=1 Tax=unclassified Lysobacter TaxID=2635362 RepID=UPI001BE64AFC|nr:MULTISPECIES: glucoamylase family protein [unclassified Lysobacter]MBT2746494.1 cyclic beta 1-2 glucan synthetase [Lysobacter sp. ISL-42]MBT2752996.1 cyclic beta 1-2 glucan synthetase [Lysobacter sp. ISL-50]MBT2777673.1 cyclic beta 1-2 glucan synthetase [Lysobacter sp. ISL-54]MBT2782444.1 cyclic beta 1-2 glucan synthetase [Lysobacter sp. ISL-52]